MKILAVGNSFSQDATALLEFLAPQLTVRNLYIPGCPLSYHSELSQTGAAAYEYQEGGERCIPQLLSLEEGLKSDRWDWITVQQVSGLSGQEDSYYPHLTVLLDYIRAHSDAKIALHQTWAYEAGSEHPEFVRYGKDREQMRQAIGAVTERIGAREGLPLLRSGELIARLREHELFDPQRGGMSLCRDGFHLSFNFGRCAAAAVWAKFFTGETPAFLQRDDLSEGYRLIAEELNK